MSKWKSIASVVLLLFLFAAVVACGGEAATTGQDPAAAAPDASALSDPEAYSDNMKDWRTRHAETFQLADEALAVFDDPENATDAQLETLSDFATKMQAAADDLKAITPPDDLSAAHSDFHAGLDTTATTFDEAARLMRDKDTDGLLAVLEAASSAIDKGDAGHKALKKALGFDPTEA